MYDIIPLGVSNVDIGFKSQATSEIIYVLLLLLNLNKKLKCYLVLNN